MSVILSRRDLIRSVVVAGTAAIPNAGHASSQVSGNIVFITIERLLSPVQLKQFTESVWSQLHHNGSDLIPIVLHDGAKIQFPSPYSFHEKLGDYEFTIGCATKEELLEVVKEIRQ